MEVITIESKAYQELVERIESIAQYVTNQNSNSEAASEVWLNSNEVADLLKISTRTLQRLRNDKMVSFTMLRGKCLYRLSDIEKSLQEKIIPTDQKTLDDLRKKYITQGISIGQ
ncbi:MAG TPA: helix-turn-helix domain-containing protein [Draconibacterium sp.]|nr:helix-turn-helix domain-containing protein [Draconibacterium sp.]